MHGKRRRGKAPALPLVLLAIGLAGCRIIPENSGAAQPPPPVQYPPEIPTKTQRAPARPVQTTPGEQQEPTGLLPEAGAPSKPSAPLPSPVTGELPPKASPTAPYSGPPLAYTRIGESRSLGGATITPLAIVEDSRCPAGAQCTWAGRVVVQVRIVNAGRSETRDVTQGQALAIAGGRLELVDVSPGRTQQGNPPPFAYQFGFSFDAGS